jgi:UDP-glucose 4-epimerase
MRIGITGSNGFIGTSLLSHLAQSSHDFIRIVRRNSTSSIPLSKCPIEVVHGDLSSPKICEQFIQGIDVIFYLAHCNSPSTSELDLPADASLNLVPLLTMIQAIRNAKSKPHVVYFGSGGAIYAARSEKIPFKETDPCRPISSYGIQKMMAEEYLRVAASRSELTATVLRVGNAYGSMLSSFRKQGLIGVTIGNVMSHRPVTLFGSLENVRDNIHLEDICELCSMLIELSSSFSIYNVGTGVGHSVMEVISTIEDCLGMRIPFQVGRSPSDFEVFPAWNVLDIARVTKELGWTPKIAFREGISRMIKSAQHPEQSSL